MSPAVVVALGRVAAIISGEPWKAVSKTFMFAERKKDSHDKEVVSVES
jgi:hypothetical protein